MIIFIMEEMERKIGGTLPPSKTSFSQTLLLVSFLILFYKFSC